MKVKHKDLDLWGIYAYFKLGYTGVSFFIAPINFIILTYNFLWFKDVLPMWTYALFFATIGPPLAIALGKYSWTRGEQRKNIDYGLKNNPFAGAQSRAWVKMLDGDIEGSKKEMEPYLKSGERK
jgi:hypothetical protein